MRRVTTRGCPSPLEKDGELQDRYLTYSYSPVYEGGEIAGLFGPVHDMTTEVITTRDLHQSEARSSRILQSIGDAVIVTDADTCVTRMNPVAETLTGWPLDEAAGRPLADVFHIVNEETRQLVESPAAKVKRLGSIVGLANHTILTAKDGTETHIDDSGAPIRNDEGQLSGIVLVFRDINEKRAAERERNAITERLNQVLEVTTDSVLSIGRDWKITYMNPTARRVSAPTGEVVGKDFWESFPATAYEGSPYVHHYYRAMDQGVTGQFEAFYPEPLNIWVQVIVQPAKDGIVLFFQDVTEQKREQVARREDERKLRLATEAAELGIFVWDIREDQVTWENDKMYEMLGRTRDDGTVSAAKFATEVVHPDDAEEFKRAVAAALEQGDRFYFQGRFYRKEGSLGWIEFTGIIEQYGSDGSPSRMLGTALDITKRKQASEALRVSEKRLRLAQNAGQMATWDWNLDTGEVIWSPGSSSVYGRPPGEMTPIDRCGAAVYEEDRIATMEALNHAIDKRVEYNHEFRVVWPDGSIRWLAGRGQAVYSQDGRPTRVLGINWDVTSRRQAEEALRESAAKLNLATAAAEIGIWVWYVGHDRSTWENDRMYEIFGRTREDAALTSAQFASEVVHPENVEDYRTAVAKALKNGDPYWFEGRFYRKDGTLGWLELKGQLEYGIDGLPLRMLGLPSTLPLVSRRNTRCSRRRSLPRWVA